MALDTTVRAVDDGYSVRAGVLRRDGKLDLKACCRGQKSFEDRDLGPFRVGVEADAEVVRVRAGIRF